MQPPDVCWLHPSVEIRASSIEGKGLFAGTSIAAGTVVVRLGGTFVSDDDLERLIAIADADPSLPYVDSISVSRDRNLLIAPGQPVHYGNHSCDPTLWHVDAFTLAARRDIASGDELTVDYGTQTDNQDFEMECRCGSALCRGQITGGDWRRPELRARYGRHWVPVLLQCQDEAT